MFYHPRSLAIVLLCLILAACSAAPPSPPTAPAQGGVIPTIAATAPAPSPEPAATARPAPAPSPPPAATAAAPALGRTLELAEPRLEGDDVRAAQTALLQLGYAEVGNADGIFGPQTELAVQRFQQRNGLEVDRVIGPRTWAALFSPEARRGDAVAVSEPLALVIDGGYGSWLIGGGGPSGWYTPPELAAGISGGEPYTLYTLEGAAAGAFTGTLAAPLGPGGGPCSEVYTVDLQPEPPRGEPRPVGVRAPWNPLPRQPQLLAPTDATYVALVRQWLLEQGIAAPEVQIERIARVDIEGDGEEEVVISATRHDILEGDDLVSIQPSIGDYSFVVVRKVIAGAVVTIPVLEEYFPTVPEFSITSTNRLLALLDLNGDGRLEIVVASDYYEGGSTLAFELEGDEVVEVLGIGCGA